MRPAFPTFRERLRRLKMECSICGAELADWEIEVYEDICELCAEGDSDGYDPYDE